MTTPRLSLADELAEIRAEIDRLKRRETALASIEDRFPVIPVFRRAWPAPGDRGPAAASRVHA
jgi:hypothetical protein